MASRNVLTIAAKMVGGKQIKKEAEEAGKGLQKLTDDVKKNDEQAGKAGAGWELFTKKTKDASKHAEKHSHAFRGAAKSAAGFATGAIGAYGLFEVARSSLSSIGETAGEVNKAQSLGLTGSTQQTVQLLAAYKARGLGMQNLQMQAKGLAKAVLTAETQEKKFGAATQKSSAAIQKKQLALLKAEAAGKPYAIAQAKLALHEAGSTAELGSKAKAFQILGINVQQFSKMSGTEQLKLVNERMSALPPSLTKTRIAAELFGKSGTKMLPLFTKGALGIGAMEKAAKEFLPSMKGGSKGLEEMELSEAKLSLATTGLKLRIGMALIPILSALMKWFTKLYDNITHGRGAWKGIEKAISTVAHVAWEFLGTAKEVVTWIAKSEVGVIALTAALVVLAGVWGVSKIASFISSIQKSTLFLALFGTGEEAVAAQSTLMWTAITGGLILVVAGIVLMVKHWNKVKAALGAVWGWIKGHWPLLAGVLFGPFGFAIAMIIKHWSSVEGFFKSLGKGIVAIFEGVGSAVANVFKAVVNASIIGPLDTALHWAHMLYRKIPDPLGVLPSWPLSDPAIPHLERGGTIRKGGTVVVGEHAPELLSLPAGARVDPLSSSRSGSLLPPGTWRGAEGDLVVSVQIDRKEIGRAVLREINAQQARRA